MAPGGVVSAPSQIGPPLSTRRKPCPDCAALTVQMAMGANEGMLLCPGCGWQEPALRASLARSKACKTCPTCNAAAEAALTP